VGRWVYVAQNLCSAPHRELGEVLSTMQVAPVVDMAVVDVAVVNVAVDNVAVYDVGGRSGSHRSGGC